LTEAEIVASLENGSEGLEGCRMTAWLLMTFPTAVRGVIVILIPTALMLLALVRVRRRYGWEKLSDNNEHGAVLFSIVGTIYAIFLAFLVVVAWDNLGEAEKSVEQEGATVLSLYRDAGGFAEPERSAVRKEIREYAQIVVDEEWDQMARGVPSEAAHEALDEVWTIFLRYEPRTSREVAVYQEALARLNELGKQRKLRVLSSEAAIPSVFWFLLIFGAVVTLGFTLFMGMSNLRVQMLMVGVLTAIIMSALFLIVVLDRPFTGDVRAEPDAFLDALRQMDHTHAGL
jgi:hypothetical protein